MRNSSTGSRTPSHTRHGHGHRHRHGGRSRTAHVPWMYRVGNVKPGPSVSRASRASARPLEALSGRSHAPLQSKEKEKEKAP